MSPATKSRARRAIARELKKLDWQNMQQKAVIVTLAYRLNYTLDQNRSHSFLRRVIDELQTGF